MKSAYFHRLTQIEQDCKACETVKTQEIEVATFLKCVIILFFLWKQKKSVPLHFHKERV